MEEVRQPQVGEEGRLEGGRGVRERGRGRGDSHVTEKREEEREGGRLGVRKDRKNGEQRRERWTSNDIL